MPLRTARAPALAYISPGCPPDWVSCSSTLELSSRDSRARAEARVEKGTVAASRPRADNVGRKGVSRQCAQLGFAGLCAHKIRSLTMQRHPLERESSAVVHTRTRTSMLSPCAAATTKRNWIRRARWACEGVVCRLLLSPWSSGDMDGSGRTRCRSERSCARVARGVVSGEPSWTLDRPPGSQEASDAKERGASAPGRKSWPGRRRGRRARRSSPSRPASPPGAQR